MIALKESANGHRVGPKKGIKMIKGPLELPYEFRVEILDSNLKRV